MRGGGRRECGARRDELTEAIWPAGDLRKTRPRPWESATDARAALGDAWIAEGQRHRLDRTKVQVDIDELDKFIASASQNDARTYIR